MFGEKPLAHWLEVLRGTDLCVEPVSEGTHHRHRIRLRQGRIGSGPERRGRQRQHYGDATRRRVRREFSVGRMAADTLAVYREAVKP